MLRGIITGLFFGGILGLMLAGLVSLVAPLPSDIAVPQAEAPIASQPETAAGTSLTETSTTDAPVQADAMAQSPAAVEGVDGAPIADLASAPRPDTANVENAPAAPTSEGDPEVALQSESPVLPNPQANPIARPGEESEPSISVDPAQPQSPVTLETQAFETPATEESSNAPVAMNDPAPEQSAPETVLEQDAVTQSVTQEDRLPAVDLDTPELAEAPEAEVTVAEVADDSVAEETASLLKPATGFEKSFEQRTSDRLPTVGAATDVVQDVSEEEMVSVAQTPLEAFAAAFEAKGDKPLMSIVLLDNPDAGVDLSALADFPLPVSIAVNAQSETAVGRVKELRDAGFEVLALMDFPAGATASDVEVNIAAQLANVPEAVALMDGFEGGLQETRDIADQVISYTVGSGHGLVLQPKGLNTTQKLAVREGVGAVTVFRDFDGKAQTEVVIRRFLDQAAFKARQNESVLMMGRLQDSTIAALASWALQDRASTVSVAPVSALLLSVK